MKKTFAILCVLMLSITIGCSSQANIGPDHEHRSGPSYDHLTVATYSTFDEMANSSPLIVEVFKTGKSSKKTHEQINYTITEVKVRQVIHGDQTLQNQAINIVELDEINMTEYDKAKKYVLFLYPHNGKIASNAYWVRGLYQGKFKLDASDKLVYDAHNYGGAITFQANIAGITVEQLKSKVRTTQMTK